MDQEYDVIVCGTGFTECILSGLLCSTQKKNVLHVDRNSYYGGESASLNLTNLFDRYKEDASSTANSKGEVHYRIGPHSEPPDSWGLNRDWNVDLIPKFIMADGKLVEILCKTGVKLYLEFQLVDGCFVYQHRKAGWISAERYIHKVPATESEALSSTLIGLTEKIGGKNFFAFIAHYHDDDQSTWQGMDPYKTTMEECYKKFGLGKNVIDFVGHALALHTSDAYLREPMNSTMTKLKLYLHSLLRYGSSPFIYPMYGLGTVPEGFSRLSAVYGGTYMLDTKVKNFLFDRDTGKIVGIQGADGQIAKCKILICDPSYCMQTDAQRGIGSENVVREHQSADECSQENKNTDTAIDLRIPSTWVAKSTLDNKIRKKGQVIRVINILNAPVPDTGNRRSCQIIFPQAQLNRQTDIYVAVISSGHGICKNGKYVALVSGTVETADPMKELEPALKLLGPIEQQFVTISDVYESIGDGKNDNVYVSSSYDAQSHFESATDNVLKLWRNIHGVDLDLTVPTPADAANSQEQN